MKLQIHIIDAFTGTLFKGNPAAVIMLQEWLPKETMLSIAAENNLSETAFLTKTERQRYDIRWFSPITEIDFCGHASLAAAFVLFKQLVDAEQLVFSCRAIGNFALNQLDDGSIRMSFPIRKPEPIGDIPAALLKGLSATPVEVLISQQAYFAVYSGEQDVYQVEADLEQLKQLAPHDVVVTSPGQSYDFVSRYFWPANGGAEDPVTGSIHAGLAPYWAEKLNKNNLRAFQASARGGLINCEVLEDAVLISGKAVQYLVGHIEIRASRKASR